MGSGLLPPTEGAMYLHPRSVLSPLLVAVAGDVSSPVLAQPPRCRGGWERSLWGAGLSGQEDIVTVKVKLLHVACPLSD